MYWRGDLDLGGILWSRIEGLGLARCLLVVADRVCDDVGAAFLFWTTEKCLRLDLKATARGREKKKKKKCTKQKIKEDLTQLQNWAFETELILTGNYFLISCIVARSVFAVMKQLRSTAAASLGQTFG
jgi:hypothetical protein